jgi:hypothetical protein
VNYFGPIRSGTDVTKRIYQANKNSELLMAYLEQKLFDSGLALFSGDQPSPNRGYGCMLYYYQVKPKRLLLSAAPRRNNSYIHVVLICGVLNRIDLTQAGFPLGNYPDPQPDMMLSEIQEIDRLVGVLEKVNSKL